MTFLYIIAGLSVLLLILQIIKKVSLSHPVLVYTGIVLFPLWCVYSAYSVLVRCTGVLDSHTVIPSESILDIFGSVSGASVIDLLLTLSICAITYLLFLVSYTKVNLFPYKSIRKCMPEEQAAAARISCIRLCRYALFMLAIYLPIAIYILSQMYEPILLGISMMAYALPWGIAGSLVILLVVPPLGLLAFLVVAGVSALVVTTMLIPLLFVALLLTAASIITLNAVIRTCTFTRRKILWLAILALFPGVNICILIYLLTFFSRKK